MQFRLDHRTLAFAAGASVGTGLLISTTSLAWHRRPDLANVLRQGVKGGLETSLSSRLRRQLIAVQVALSVALLVGTELTVRSLLRLGQVDTGIRTDGVLVASVAGDIVANSTPEESIARHARGFRQMRDALASTPWGSKCGGASIRTSGRPSSVSSRTRHGIRPMTAAWSTTSTTGSFQRKRCAS